jgi:exosortase J
VSASGNTRFVPVGSGASLAPPRSDAGSRDYAGRRTRLLSSFLWPWIALLTLAGSLGVSPQFAKLWEIWTGDPLRSIGMLILPASILLILRTWRQSGWELNGTWWGLVPVIFAYAPLLLSERVVFFWTAGDVRVNFLPSVLPIYFYASGILLLFGGTRLWRLAWFPLLLLLFLQPVPEVIVQYLDIPMQSLAAHTARSFAHLLGVSPTRNELLRLMFTPRFGMFIAPGCDGMRGAVTLGYGALIAGYIRRVSVLRWAALVAGGVLLGHVFNLLRLCALVLYYRIAIGHLLLERSAEQADYAIGALLFLVAVFLFLWIFFSKATKEMKTADRTVEPKATPEWNWGATYWKTVALAALVLPVVVPGVRAANRNPENLAVALHRGTITAHDLDERLPAQVGDYRLARAWQEQVEGVSVLEAAAFASDSSGEMEIGIWLPPSDHSIERSLMTQGEVPTASAVTVFSTADGRTVPFNTALYDDGITDTFIGDTYCTPLSCQASSKREQGLHLTLDKVIGHNAPGERAVPVFFKIQVLRNSAPAAFVYKDLSARSQTFLAHLNLTQLSQEFQ